MGSPSSTRAYGALTYSQRCVPQRRVYSREFRRLELTTRVRHRTQAHRVNVQKLEAEQRQAAAEAERSSAKRRREDGPGDDEEGGEGDASKRARDGDEVGRLPSGFFADPSQAPPPAPSTSSSAAGAGTNGSSTSVANQGRDAAQEGEEDPEWAEFEKYLASGNAGPAQDNNGATRSTASATIKAAPVKFEFGAPVVEEDGEGGAGGEDDEPDEEEEQETEEERTEREMREEREEMMARLEEEEREQREADEKVTVRSMAPPLSRFCVCRIVATRFETVSDLLHLLSVDRL